MRIIIYLSICLFLLSCQNEKPATLTQNDPFPFEVLSQEEHQIQFKQLRLYPIVADETAFASNHTAAEAINLKQALTNSRFRITEKKPFGRFQDRDAVNSLTVQNKTQDTVFLMAGDMVQGGLQDRVIAMDQIIAPRTIKDIGVFCVEPNRWSLEEEQQTPTEESTDKIYAFRGYYNVGANQLRKSVTQQKDQQKVWATVKEIVAMHNAENATGAYDGLEASNTFTSERDHYLNYFKDRFQDKENVIGIMATSGSQFLGADLFGHPNLFQQQYEALLHAYITDAVAQDSESHFAEDQLQYYLEKLETELVEPTDERSHQLWKNGQLIHFSFL